ncbi:MAG: cell division protein [Thalassolituus sp.]|nr:penicillin-binding protein 2 [Pseudomonadota bacterium]MEC8102446.1 penicillin-binding protein 2 [Pseudomonadota bacterium]MEC8523439.1 penicillin-binding protein 2 [Pseudomonadota bacterium]MEE2749205.1 penicillin-binding protein 2 [Pseudomonadota bacterium]TNC87452.1 MAG: cell division protein [Thalassolituus sp.]
MSTQEQPQTEGIQRWRFTLVLAVFALLLVVVGGRLVMLHTVEQPFLFEQGEKRTVRSEVQPATRGMITDRFGEPLAVSTPVTTLWVNPQQVDVNALSDVARMLGLNSAELKRRVSRAARQGRSFYFIKRQVQPELAERVLSKKVAGLYADNDYRRYYPAAEVTSHTLGLVNIDGQGQEGLELAFDDYLSGSEGSRQVVKDLYGNVIKQLGVKAVAEPGHNLQLTLDLRLQYLAYRELKAVVQSHKATAGSAVMLDAKTGEVLALVSQPSYNPNNRAELNPTSMRNRAIADLVEPGSTMKPFTVAAAMESGRYDANTIVDTAPGWIRVKNKAIRDHRNYGDLDLTGIITKSSNVGVSKLAQDLGPESIWTFFNHAGLGRPGTLGFPGEAVGAMPYPEQMDDLRLSTVSYGYGLSVSPLQLAEAYTSFTDGCRKPVSLLLSQVGQQPCEPVMSEDTAKQVLKMLGTVVGPKGTGQRAAVEGYQVGGKTGTAHKVGRSGYEDSEYTAVFAGVAPLSDPDLVLVVIVDEPQGKEYYGGEVAAPVFSRVMEQALRLRQVIPDAPAQDSWLQVAGGAR